MMTIYWPTGKKMRTLTHDDFEYLTINELMCPHPEYNNQSKWWFLVHDDKTITYTLGDEKDYVLEGNGPEGSLANVKKIWYRSYCYHNGYTMIWDALPCWKTTIVSRNSPITDWIALHLINSNCPNRSKPISIKMEYLHDLKEPTYPQWYDSFL